MSIGGTAGRLVELGERKRGAQFEAAGLLMSRDGDRGEERLFGETGVCGILLEKDFAAHAVEFRVEPALSAAFEILERMIEGGERGRRLAISRFRFRQSRPDQRQKRPDIVSLKQGIGSPEIRKTDFRDAGA